MASDLPVTIIIDDDELILDRLTSLLQVEFQVKTAKTAAGGLELLYKNINHNPLVVCDIDLPDGNGFYVCKTIKSQHPKTYVMLLTGFNSHEVRIRGLNSYADNCLDKTLTDTEIKLLIRNAHNTMQPRTEIATPEINHKANVGEKLSDFENNLKNYILEHYTKPVSDRNCRDLSLDDISKWFCMDKRTFQRRITAIAGCSYTKYLARTKIEKSKELLTQNYSVTQISEVLEYSSPSHYSREFKKITLMTPNKYKSAIRKLQ